MRIEIELESDEHAEYILTTVRGLVSALGGGLVRTVEETEWKKETRWDAILDRVTTGKLIVLVKILRDVMPGYGGLVDYVNLVRRVENGGAEVVARNLSDEEFKKLNDLFIPAEVSLSRRETSS